MSAAARWWLRTAALLLAVTLLGACGRSTPALPKLTANDVVLAFGDSLTYGIGAREEESYPAVLQGLIGRHVAREGFPGEVTAQGVQRLPALLDEVLKDVLYDNAYKSDPIHPNAQGYRKLAERLAELLRRAGAV